MRREAGFTLAELLLGTMLVAIMALATMSVAVTGKGAGGRTDRRAAAARSVASLSEKLRGYVTADTSLVAGPGSAPNGWGLPGDKCGCYALASGRHELDAATWLPDLAAKPYDGKISYSVTNMALAQGDQPTVAYTVSWTEP